jgi:hypothetical protein
MVVAPTTATQARRKAQIALLRDEMDTLHRANLLYWKKGRGQTSAERAKYQFDEDRLEIIRSELAKLGSA